MKTYSYGIDISSWQGDIDLQKLNPGFVIIRAGCGKSVDSKALRNMKLCEALEIPYGVYWYSYALSIEAAKAEAEACLKVIAGRKIDVGVWCDMEDADGYKARNNALNKDLTSAMAYAFADTIEKAGYYSGIYASLSWLKEGYVAGCERFDKWVACWGSNTGNLTTDTSMYGTLHQYAGDIKKDGYNLDFNVSYVPLSHYFMGNHDNGEEEKPQEPENNSGESSSFPPTLSMGDSGGYVKAVQRQLIAMGFNCGGKKDVFGREKPDGQYGTKTRDAVSQLQEQNGMEPNGTTDLQTWPLVLNY